MHMLRRAAMVSPSQSRKIGKKETFFVVLNLKFLVHQKD
jgi:hypothetical protein